MNQFIYHTEETAPEASKEALRNAKKVNGFVPNLFAVMAEAPGLLESYRVVGDQFANSSFDANELTVVWQTINVEHECRYCVPAHTLIANGMKVDQAIINALRDETPLPTEKLEILRRFTLSVVRGRGVVDEAEVQVFLEAGYTKRQILEVILGLSQKVMSNYVNHFAETKLDPAFEKFIWKKNEASAHKHL